MESGYVHQVGVNKDVKDWLAHRRSFFKARSTAKKFETIPSSIQHRLPYQWHEVFHNRILREMSDSAGDGADLFPGESNPSSEVPSPLRSPTSPLLSPSSPLLSPGSMGPRSRVESPSDDSSPKKQHSGKGVMSRSNSRNSRVDFEDGGFLRQASNRTQGGSESTKGDLSKTIPKSNRRRKKSSVAKQMVLENERKEKERMDQLEEEDREWWLARHGFEEELLAEERRSRMHQLQLERGDVSIVQDFQQRLEAVLREDRLGHDVSSSLRALLMEALETRSPRLLALALEMIPEDTKNIVVDNYGNTLLHIAAWRGDYLKVEQLLAADANPLIRDHKRNSALHLSIKRLPVACQGLRITRHLLAAGSDVNAQNDRGFTALHEACLLGHTGLVELLLASGADVYVLDKKNKLALEYAGHKSERVSELMRHHETAANRHRHGRMWSHILSRELVSLIFMEVEPSCVKCGRKYSACALLKVEKFRYWLLVHGKDMS